MMTELDPTQMVAPKLDLERAYIAQYLRGVGCDPDHIHELPEAQRHDLLCAASMFASTRLAEVEAKSHLIDEMHGGEHAI
ncbi:hypothetical protein [Candidatus Oscillochloris fontis]|uniref:hypothetical protein n=1 Tax=Candidatus Oscillochloris fontis TaxID=2496868 RepID=UPI00101BF60A|nr:hypothetical protein [Candidatus Oscillochloris fontis]